MPDDVQTPKMITNTIGDKYWCLNGVYHREDGPAIERTDGTTAWFLNGKELTEDQFLDWKFIKWCTTPVEYTG